MKSPLHTLSSTSTKFKQHSSYSYNYKWFHHILNLDQDNYTQAYIGAVSETALNTESQTNVIRKYESYHWEETWRNSQHAGELDRTRSRCKKDCWTLWFSPRSAGARRHRRCRWRAAWLIGGRRGSALPNLTRVTSRPHHKLLSAPLGRSCFPPRMWRFHRSCKQFGIKSDVLYYSECKSNVVTRLKWVSFIACSCKNSAGFSV
jgi:hypothetical protein